MARAGIGTADLTTPPLCKKTHKVQVDSLQMATSGKHNSHAHEKRVTSAQVIKTGSDNSMLTVFNAKGGLISEGT